jgi:hypothetical protein
VAETVAAGMRLEAEAAANWQPEGSLAEEAKAIQANKAETKLKRRGAEEAIFIGRLACLPGGKAEMDANGGLWTNRYRENPGKARRVLNDVERQMKEGRSPEKSLGAWLTDTWKRFK